jgi:mannan endo-1,4-beta-mannosidase
VNILVDPSKDTARISPYIYGSNGQSNDRPFNITARRIGGNRLTGYNWENNASNMGMDYDQSNSNDNYLTWVAGIPPSKENTPGIVLTAFHDTSLAMGCYSLITLPAAGFVSRDKAGSVSAAQKAPSPRWREVRAFKGAPLSTNPDTSDGIVSVDEEVNFLVSHYGGSDSPHGVRGYEVDNEPALWPYTHPRLHPDTTRCLELISKIVATGRAVKSVDPSAEVFGGVAYGFNEIYSLQDAPDWPQFRSKYGRFANMLLGRLKDSSTVAGSRLMDVLDVHWYPDLNLPVRTDASDSATAAARMNAPRSLWDSTYREDGWIGQWFMPVSLIPNLMTAISQYNPGTKLAITEFYYGAPADISGGLAIADVLGIFGRYGVYFASHWGALEQYIGAAYQLYRNYDGAGSTFGPLRVRARTDNVVVSSAYASTDENDGGRLHLVLINKDRSHHLNASVTIEGGTSYTRGNGFALSQSGPTVQAVGGEISIVNNQFSYDLPPLSAHHLVLSGAPASVTTSVPALPKSLELGHNYPNPFNPTTVVSYQLSAVSDVKLVVYDVLGREVATLVNERKQPGTYHVQFDGSQFASGTYFYRLEALGSIRVRRMLLVR